MWVWVGVWGRDRPLGSVDVPLTLTLALTSGGVDVTLTLTPALTLGGVDDLLTVAEPQLLVGLPAELLAVARIVCDVLRVVGRLDLVRVRVRVRVRA